MKKRLYSVVLLFSFLFCSGGFLVAHADSASVLDWSVNKGDNVKPDDYYSGRSFDFHRDPVFHNGNYYRYADENLLRIPGQTAFQHQKHYRFWKNKGLEKSQSISRRY